MSACLSEESGIKARKRHRCALCCEPIEIGEIYLRRNGVDGGDFWTMKMHPECHAYEGVKGVVDEEWYESAYDPAFDRADAIAHKNKLDQIEHAQ